MEQCGGALLVHSDSSAAACTEELEGRCCPGPQALHLGGQVSCQDVLGVGGCESCTGGTWPEWDWRHVVHVGHVAQRPRRCVAHERVRQVTPAPSGFELLLPELDAERRFPAHRLVR